MNDTIELLSRRRSVPVRLLADPGPSADELNTILTIASRVPDHGVVVPWRFIVIDRDAGAEFGKRIAKVYAAAHPEATPEQLELERNRLARAPLAIAVVSSTREHPKAPEWEQILSAGAACMSIEIAANALGYGSNWHTEWIAFDSEIMSALGLAPTERIAGFIYIGTRIEQPAERKRPALEEIVTKLGA